MFRVSYYRCFYFSFYNLLLIVNENMTKQEALKAKKQLKNNSLTPALSTRSNDRVLRSNK